ncbi:MAG: ribonuclease Z [Spirochaetales bacterium]|nr:ribonuclease Z [Spirochaetales bacterium]
MILEAFILGSGGMMPLPGRALTSVLLRREGELLLFDCGEGTQVSLRRLNIKWKKISVIFISHIHADHVTGLPGILMLSSQVDRDEPLYIIGPPRIREYIEANKKILEMYINYTIKVIEIHKPGIVFEGDGYRVRGFFLNHTKQCIGYSLEEDVRPGVFFPEKAIKLGIPKGPLWSQLQRGEQVVVDKQITVKPEDVLGPARKGRKFSFVTDTLYKTDIAENIAHSDLFICEGMFAEDMSENAEDKKHLTARQAAKIACDGNVKKMGLIHYSPRYTFHDLKILLEEARELFPESFLTKDCQTIPIPYPDE